MTKKFTKTGLNILILDNKKTEVEEIIRVISNADIEAVISIAINRKDFLKQVKSFKPSFIVSEYALPDFTATEAIKYLLEHQIKIPFIIVTGPAFELSSIELVKAGMDDYILKNNLARLPVAILKAIEKHKIDVDKEHAFLQMKTSQERLRNVFNNEPDCIKIVNLKGDLEDMNEAGLNLIEAESLNEIKGKKIIELIHPDDRAKYNKFHSQASRGHRSTLQFRIVGLKGTIRNMFSNAIPLRDENNAVYTVMYVTKDITEKLRTEEELKLSEQRFHIVMQATDDVICEWDMVRNNMWCNENFFKVFGFYPSTNVSFETWASNIHPDDKARVQASLNKSIETGVQFWSEKYRFLKADKSIVHIFYRGIIIYDEKKKPLRMICSMINITERKNAEDRSATNEENFRFMVENAADLVMALDPDGMISYLNPAIEKLTGYTASELSKKKLYDFIRHEDATILQKQFKKLIRIPGFVSRFKYRFKHKNGKWISFDSLAKSAVNRKGKNMIILNSRDAPANLRVLGQIEDISK